MSLKPSVVCVPVKDVSDPLLNRIEKTYNDSFPEVERRDFALVRDLLSDEPRFIIYALLKNDEYVGFITRWTFENFAYSEHFAIDAAARNGGIGAKAMEQFLAICGAPIVIEVEAPEDEMSRRRIGFYERLGFVLDSHVYHQPPYRQGGDGLEMRLMSYGQINLSDSFDKVKQIIYENVYGAEI